MGPPAKPVGGATGRCQMGLWVGIRHHYKTIGSGSSRVSTSFRPGIEKLLGIVRHAGIPIGDKVIFPINLPRRSKSLPTGTAIRDND